VGLANKQAQAHDLFEKPRARNGIEAITVAPAELHPPGPDLVSGQAARDQPSVVKPIRGRFFL